MQLTMARPGNTSTIKNITGKAEVRQHLENLGLVAGSPVTVISELSGNIIINVRQTRIAISREMANKIIV